MLDKEELIEIIRYYNILTSSRLTSKHADVFYDALKDKKNEHVKKAVKDLAIFGERFTLRGIILKISEYESLEIERQAARAKERERNESKEFFRGEAPSCVKKMIRALSEDNPKMIKEAIHEAERDIEKGG